MNYAQIVASSNCGKPPSNEALELKASFFGGFMVSYAYKFGSI
jgi:hypothetical protein